MSGDMTRHDVANNAFTTLAAAVGPGDSEVTVVASIMDDMTAPFYADIGTELISVAAVTPGSPNSTWTVTRAVAGVAGTYTAGDAVIQRIYAEQIQETHRLLLAIERAICQVLGENDGVVLSSTREDNLLVAHTTGVQCSVQPGSGTLGHRLFALLEEETLTFERPLSGTRTDLVQIDAVGAVTIKQGSATADTDNLALAEVTVPDAGDISTIVDRRVYT